MHGVSWYRVWKGVADAGAQTPNQVVLWEDLMDGATLLLTGNCETVYGLCAIDLKRDGPVVIEAPAWLLGGISDLWQREIMGVGPTGARQGQGRQVPAAAAGSRRRGARRLHGGQVADLRRGVRRARLPVGRRDRPGGRADEDARRSIRCRRRRTRRRTTFVNGSRKEIDTIFSDTGQYFADLAWMIEREPHDTIPSHERFQLAAIGIEKGKPFTPDAARKALLDDAARFASAIARTNSFDSDDPARLVYPDRAWEWAFIGGSADWDSQGYVNTDRRSSFAYIAIGMSPAMVEKHVGTGSQYLWTPRDASGAFLDGGKRYRLHIPPNIPAKNFWSVVAYDADSRSILRSGQPFPSVSTYTGPRRQCRWLDRHRVRARRADRRREPARNWIQTTPGKGWFTLFRFYGPLEPFFDQTWKPDDIVEVKWRIVIRVATRPSVRREPHAGPAPSTRARR